VRNAFRRGRNVHLKPPCNTALDGCLRRCWRRRSRGTARDVEARGTMVAEQRPAGIRKASAGPCAGWIRRASDRPCAGQTGRIAMREARALRLLAGPLGGEAPERESRSFSLHFPCGRLLCFDEGQAGPRWRMQPIALGHVAATSANAELAAHAAFPNVC
jgi:hypothetical protein